MLLLCADSVHGYCVCAVWIIGFHEERLYDFSNSYFPEHCISWGSIQTVGDNKHNGFIMQKDLRGNLSVFFKASESIYIFAYTESTENKFLLVN